VPWFWIILVALLAVFIVAVRELPWWGVILLVLGLFAAAPYIGRLVLAFYVRKVGRELAAALRGATVEVAEVRAVPPPDAALLKQYEEEMGVDEEGDEEDDTLDEPPEARHWYELTATITPASGTEDSAGWDPDTLLLVPPETPKGEITQACYIARVEIIEPHRTVPREGRMCFEGTQLRFLLGVVPGTKRLSLRYMFIEEIGDAIELPPPVELPATPRAD
jgi:hypothetical protein